MSLISLLVVLVVFGAVLYIVQLLPIDGTIKRIIGVVVVVVLLLYVLQAFGLISGTGIRLR
jgi:hypothetical protein